MVRRRHCCRLGYAALSPDGEDRAYFDREALTQRRGYLHNLAVKASHEGHVIVCVYVRSGRRRALPGDQRSGVALDANPSACVSCPAA